MHELVFLGWLTLFAATFLGLGLLAEFALRRFLPADVGLFGRWVLGLGVALLLAFGLTATGLLGKPASLALLLLAGAGFFWRWRALTSPVALPTRWSRVDLLPGLMLLSVLLPLFLMALSPAVHWDAAVYHLALPRIYLETGGFVPVELSVYSVWPHGPQLVYAFGLLWGGPALAKLLHFGCGILVLGGLAHALRRSELPGWRLGLGVAAFSFLIHPVVLFEMQAAYVDLVMALFYLAAFLFLARTRTAPEAEQPGWLLLAGIAAGGVAVCKPTGALFLAPFLAILLPFWLGRGPGHDGSAPRGRTRLLLLVLTRFLPPILLLWLPWLWRSFRLTGNPLYPFVGGGPDWSPALAEQLLTWQRGIGMGRTPLDYLLLPWRVLTQGDTGYAHFDGKLSPLLILPLLLALFRASRPSPPPLLRPALAVAGSYFLFWAASSQQMRFLIPMLPLLALAGGLAAADFAAPLLAAPSRWRWAPALALLFPLAVYGNDPALLRKGLQHASVYRHPGFVYDPWDAAPPFRAAINTLPPTAKVLMLNWNQGYFCPRPFLADSFYEASQISDWLEGATTAELPARLAERGVSHVLFHPQWRVRYPPAVMELLGDRDRLRPVWAAPDQSFILFELNVDHRRYVNR